MKKETGTEISAYLFFLIWQFIFSSNDENESNDREPTPFETDITEVNAELIIADPNEDQNIEKNKDQSQHKDSLAIPSKVSYTAGSDQNSDPMSKHKMCPSESIGRMSEIRTIKHSIKVKSEVNFIENIMKCCIAENGMHVISTSSEITILTYLLFLKGFDLYQIVAFDADTKVTWTDWIKYVFHSLKAVLCALTQIFGMIIIMFDFIQSGLDTKDWCNSPKFSIFLIFCVNKLELQKLR